MTDAERADAGRIAVQLMRASREVTRAVQAADVGDGRMLDYILRAELDVEGVRRRLLAVRRRLAMDVIGS